jgi:hypothetical protein
MHQDPEGNPLQPSIISHHSEAGGHGVSTEPTGVFPELPFYCVISGQIHHPSRIEEELYSSILTRLLMWLLKPVLGEYGVQSRWVRMESFLDNRDLHLDFIFQRPKIPNRLLHTSWHVMGSVVTSANYTLFRNV